MLGAGRWVEAAANDVNFVYFIHIITRLYSLSFFLMAPCVMTAELRFCTW